MKTDGIARIRFGKTSSWILGFALAFYLATISARSQVLVVSKTIVVPEGFASKEGPTRTPYPFWPGFFGGDETSVRLQQCYEGALFPGYQEGDLIEGIAFRISADRGEIEHSFDVTFANVEVHVSTFSKPRTQLDPTFSKNVGSDEAVVYNGPLHWRADFNPGQVQAMSLIIPFGTPFSYNPSHGALLLDITVRGGMETGFVDAAGSPHLGIVRGFGLPSTKGEVVGGAGLVTRFEIQSIPEPATALLAVAAVAQMLAFAALRRSRSTR